MSLGGSAGCSAPHEGAVELCAHARSSPGRCCAEGCGRSGQQAAPLSPEPSAQRLPRTLFMRRCCGRFTADDLACADSEHSALPTTDPVAMHGKGAPAPPVLPAKPGRQFAAASMARAGLPMRAGGRPCTFTVPSRAGAAGTSLPSFWPGGEGEHTVAWADTMAAPCPPHQ